MPTPPRELELNEQTRRRDQDREFREHLINASNELYLHEQLCLQYGRPCPEALTRAHAAIRAELARLEGAPADQARAA